MSDHDLDEDCPLRSRLAIDSNGTPMQHPCPVRMSDELRLLGGRKARSLNLTLGEYLRILLDLAVDSTLETVIQNEVARVIRKHGGPAMPCAFTVRIHEELQILGERKAASHGLPFGAYLRILLDLAVDSALEPVIQTEVERVLRKHGRPATH